MGNPYVNVEGAARFVLEQFEVPVTKTGEEDVQQLLENIREGKCQACGSALGKNTVVMVNRAGPVGAYCSGPCLQDQAVLEFLQESFDDIKSAMSFRANPSEADGEAAED